MSLSFAFLTALAAPHPAVYLAPIAPGPQFESTRIALQATTGLLLDEEVSAALSDLALPVRRWGLNVTPFVDTAQLWATMVRPATETTGRSRVRCRARIAWSASVGSVPPTVATDVRAALERCLATRDDEPRGR